MATMKASERAKLPDTAFAYVDSSGRRRLPINDEAHVRNALARFNQVAFEDDAARERARSRLLKAAKKYGIVPVGFIDGQLRSERVRAAGPGDPSTLPTGSLTLLLTDIEGSTALLSRLGDRYAGLLRDVRHILRQAVAGAGGREVEARADEFFAVFERAAGAVECAVDVQLALAGRTWPEGVRVRVRAGIHSGRPTLTDSGYIGLSVHTAARVCSAAHGAQILVSSTTRGAARESVRPGVRFRHLGRFLLAGLPQDQALFQVEADGLSTDFPLPRADASRRAGATRSAGRQR